MTVSRAAPGGALYLDLQKKARDTKRPVQEVLQLFILEAFLDRLTRSHHRDVLVLKGGVLLAAFGGRRPTRDVDLQAQAMSNDVADVRAMVVAIADIDNGDGVAYATDDATAHVIRDDDAYTGVRVSMTARLATAKLAFHVDVNVGDPIDPKPQHIDLPRLLGGSITLYGYPLEMVHAEKIVTAVSRGTVNTRWRDFMDVVALSKHHPMDGVALIESVRRVAAHRDVELESLADVLEGYGAIGQHKWAAWRRKQGVKDTTPESFDDLIQTFIRFANPVILGSAAGLSWDPGSGDWT